MASKRGWLRGVFIAVGLAIGVHVVSAQLSGLRETGIDLVSSFPITLAAMLGLEAFSLFSYGVLIRVSLAAPRRELSEWRLQKTVLAGFALGKVLPGGTVGSLAATVKPLTSEDRGVLRVATALAGSGFVSSAVLIGLLGVAVIPVLLTGELAGRALAVVIGVAVTVLGLGALLTPALLWPQKVGNLVRRIVRPLAHGPLKGKLDPDEIGEQVAVAIERSGEIIRNPRRRGAALVWATLNWVADMAVLGLVVFATAGLGGLPAVPLAYALGNAAAAVPLTPGGVGVVEAVATATLVAGGVDGAAATAAVLGWRLVAHWLPIVIGLILLPSLPGGIEARDAVGGRPGAVDG